MNNSQYGEIYAKNQGRTLIGHKKTPLWKYLVAGLVCLILFLLGFELMRYAMDGTDDKTVVPDETRPQPRPVPVDPYVPVTPVEPSDPVDPTPGPDP